jgi:CBS domain-containing protein
MLSTHKISGAAVVDPAGAFVANTSGADLKLYLQAPHSERLHQPVMAFIGDVRRAAGMAGAQTVAPAVSVRPCSSLLQVIAKLTATGMHRVFVCEPESERPLAVISVEDVVSMLYRGCPSRKLDRQLHRALSLSQLGEKSPLLANHPSNASTGSAEQGAGAAASNSSGNLAARE